MLAQTSSLLIVVVHSVPGKITSTQIQTHKGSMERCLLGEKHNPQILGVNPFSRYKTTLKQQLNGEKWSKIKWKAKSLTSI